MLLPRVLPTSVAKVFQTRSTLCNILRSSFGYPVPVDYVNEKTEIYIKFVSSNSFSKKFTDGRCANSSPICQMPNATLDIVHFLHIFFFFK